MDGEGVLEIDGSYGEGGGAVLRTALSLAAITGRAILIFKIRLGRKNPGLAAQHLTAVRAVASICSASISGDALFSTCLHFIPRSRVVPGTYTFDVGDAREGSAGAVSLVLQTILFPLALSEGTSTVKIMGGTHVTKSPSTSYLEHVYLPVLRNMGVDVTMDVQAWGWNPEGGGCVEVCIEGNCSLQGLKIVERGALKMVRAIAAVTELPDEIVMNMAHEAQSALQRFGFDASVVDVKSMVCQGPASGRGLFIFAEYTNATGGFCCFAHAEKRAAKKACGDMMEFHRCGAPVDHHLGDQLLLPACLAMQESEYVVSDVTLHLTTNAWVIETFGIAKVIVDEASKKVSIIPKQLTSS